ncbi:HD-GYP domain-containing protein [Chromobacterium rhizoryzae]|uniref:HD domain-containing protein n=2 Tax=Chromobacterium TaxID=535 RepID=A0AAD0RRB7_9NEIS|nr:HD domain-containing phosphohydrolase [Chromobacterium rhizoryzae]AXT46589.1 HD domain-containing protein [Chromobacterium rhizoryzae]
MGSFERMTMIRIGLISLILSLISGPTAWLIASTSAQNEIVQLAMEESKRILLHFDSNKISKGVLLSKARIAATGLSGGMFDIAEIYDQDGGKLAESMTTDGSKIEDQLPSHGKPSYIDAFYESVKLEEGLWVLRVFVPLKDALEKEVFGYFEGVRIVPDWQRKSIESSAIRTAIITALASLACGVAIFPIVLKLSKDNKKKAYQILDSHIAMMEALGRAIAKRDSDTGTHNYRVAWIAARIGEEFGLKGEAMQALIIGSFLHDVGKIGIPDSILLKKGKLDPDEMAIMKTHVNLGEEIVNGIGWLGGAHQVVAGHHEKWDGSGYPRSLAGREIPRLARIFAVADVFDALSSKRPYKDPFPFDHVIDILKKNNGLHFDPEVIDVFLKIAKGIHDRLRNISEKDARDLLTDKIKLHFWS